MIQKADFPYSLKNVPIPSPAAHLKATIASTEKFLQRARWRCKFFLQPKKPNAKSKFKWGFKTSKSCEQIKELIDFESDLSSLISNFEYSDMRSPFQKKLAKDVKKINKSPNLFVTADKTSNVYEIDPDTYQKLVQNNVTSCYSKTDPQTVQEINSKAKTLATKLEIAERVEVLAQKDAYITIKDHKDKFPEEIKCRLINPCKTNIGRITKQILERINNDIITKLDLDQLKNTSAAINWFDNIRNKKDKYLIQIDLVDYYPSVTDNLLTKTLEFAETITNISALEKDLINHARLSVLYHDDQVWRKSNGLFDVTMGSYDGAQITDLVGLMLLAKMRDKFPDICFALYRDDGIGHHKRIKPQQLEKLKQQLRGFFREYTLEITVDTGLTQVNFLDVTFDLHNNTYQPYRKPNDNPLYIHTQSNHPKHIVNNVPLAINKRLSEIASSEDLFNESRGIYQNALTNSGYKFKLKYQKPSYNETQLPSVDNRTEHTLPPPPPLSPPPLHTLTSVDIQPPQPPHQSQDTNDAPPPRRSQRLRVNSNNLQSHRPPDPNPDPTTKAHSPQQLGPRRSQRIQNQAPNTPSLYNPADQPSTSNTGDRPTSNTTPTPTPNMNRTPTPSYPTASPLPTSNTTQPRKHKNKKDILWFNPPFNLALKTKFGQLFLKLLEKHFPVNHPLYPVMNRTKCKISYSCSPSMQSIINSHNKRILQKRKKTSEIKQCNCRNKAKCPIPDNLCRKTSVIYKAQINNAMYYGLTCGEIKDRITCHRQTFREKYKENSTALSKYIWSKDLNKNENDEIVEPEIKWSILQQCHTYKPGSKNCDLCLTEKFFIINNINKPGTINKKTDIAVSCIHRRPFLLAYIK